MGSFYIIDVTNGRELQSFILDGAVYSGAAYFDSSVYIITDKGLLYCLGEMGI